MYGINIPELEKCVNKFHGGNISSQILNWKRTTKDKVILDIIQHGLKLRIVDKPVTNAPCEYPISMDETAIIDREIQKLLRKRVIEEVMTLILATTPIFSPIGKRMAVTEPF